VTEQGSRDYDVVVIGAGPAGLTAGLYAGRARLRTVMLERMGPGGQLLNTELIEDYTGFKSITGMEMANLFEEHAREHGATWEYGEVEALWSEGRWKVVRTADGEEYRAKAVIVCSGGMPRKLGVPGEAEFAGRGVSYCAICDGAFFKGQALAVVGGGDSAVEEATFLTRYASTLSLIHRRDEFRAQKVLQDRALAQKNLRPIYHTVVEEIGGGDRVEWMRLRNIQTGEQWQQSVGGVFIYVGFEPNSGFFRDPVEKDPMGFVITDEKMETSIPGIFCAGDVRAQYVRQITNAVGDATTAAIAATRYIEALDHNPKADLAEIERETEAALKAGAAQYP
jgi:thioredoxin reductase (NADPH)